MPTKHLLRIYEPSGLFFRICSKVKQMILPNHDSIHTMTHHLEVSNAYAYLDNLVKCVTRKFPYTIIWSDFKHFHTNHHNPVVLLSCGELRVNLSQIFMQFLLFFLRNYKFIAYQKILFSCVCHLDSNYHTFIILGNVDLSLKIFNF